MPFSSLSQAIKIFFLYATSSSKDKRFFDKLMMHMSSNAERVESSTKNICVSKLCKLDLFAQGIKGKSDLTQFKDEFHIDNQGFIYVIINTL